MCRLTFFSQNEEDTELLGSAMADVVASGTTIALIGTLGAGKTRLVQAVAVATGVPRESVTSPTFVLCHEYSFAHSGIRVCTVYNSNLVQIGRNCPSHFGRKSV